MLIAGEIHACENSEYQVLSPLQITLTEYVVQSQVYGRISDFYVY